MRGAPPRHHTSAVVRLAGHHEADVAIVRQTVRLYIPGVMVTIADKWAAQTIWKVWRDAEQALTKIFQEGKEASSYLTPSTEGIAYASIRFQGKLKGRDIAGKTPTSSPSGCGELKIRLGCLIIICDDLAAAKDQIAAWSHACELAQREPWPELSE